MTSRTNQHSERQDQIGNMPAPLSALQLRRQDAVKRYLAGEPIEAICRELGCSKSWLYKWKPRYEAPEPTWSQERSRRPRTTPTKTPAAVEMAIVRLRESFSPGVSAQVIRDHLSRHQGESIPSRRTIAPSSRGMQRRCPHTHGYPKSQVAHCALVLPRDEGLTGGGCPQRGVSGMTVRRHACAQGLVEEARWHSGPVQQAVV